MDETQVISPAYDAGHERGEGQGSWVFDGNTDEATVRRVLKGIEESDPEVMDMQPSPLSGEWAGESIPELSDQYGLNLEDEDIADEFERGFGEGFWDEVFRSGRAILGIPVGDHQNVDQGETCPSCLLPTYDERGRYAGDPLEGKMWEELMDEEREGFASPYGPCPAENEESQSDG